MSTQTSPTPTSTAQRIATALLARRRQIAMAFRASDATSPGGAASLQQLGLRHDAPFEDLIQLGVIHRIEQRFWFDDTQFERKIERPRFRLLGMGFVALMLTLLLVAMLGVFTA